ncbi:hypothetical protein [Neobacillus mesonae]|nr:hypothetical protein [Neobacillus mesonae]
MKWISASNYWLSNKKNNSRKQRDVSRKYSTSICKEAYLIRRQ